MPVLAAPQALRPSLGLLRSLLVYYGNPAKQRRMRHFYAQFVQPGALCFDVGAHVGNRVRAFLALGARVVAVEPQPGCAAVLRRLYGRSPRVQIVASALGAQPGTLPLWVSRATPTVSSLSRPWIETMQQDASFAGVEWDEAVPVNVTTLDELIDGYGEPAFCKIDVEGFELEVLRGLSRAPAALSFEYVAAARAGAAECVLRLASLGDYRFNWSHGEEHRWQQSAWQSTQATLDFLARLEPGHGSGDIYARRSD